MSRDLSRPSRILAAVLRATFIAGVSLLCSSFAVTTTIAQVNGDRVEILKNPTPPTGSIFDRVQLPDNTFQDGDFLLREDNKESIKFAVVGFGRDFLNLANEKTQILLTDSAGLSDALVVTRGQFSLDFLFTSDAEGPLNLNDFPGQVTNIPETGNDQFPGIGAEALLNVTSVIFPNVPAGTTLPITVLIASDRDAVDEPPTVLQFLIGGLAAVAAVTRLRRSSR